MAYYVRLLTVAEAIIPFKEIEGQGNFIRLISGTDSGWSRIEISEPENNHIATLERLEASADNAGEKELEKLKDSIQGCYPVSARAWIKDYLSRIRVIYAFQLSGDNITKKGWPVLGRIQNLLKDRLTGIIQADREGFYNENGDLILWQMYEGATGTIPAATLDENGQWAAYQLKLDSQSIERFKEGIPPRKGWLDRMFRNSR